MTTVAPVVEARRQAAGAGTLLYAGAIFAGAFLLFQIQPIIAKVILAWFGGSAAVWTACMLFFQTLLLAGYLYAYGVVRLLPPKAQALLHAGLLLASLCLLPVTPKEGWKPSGSEEPTLRILGLLGASIGLPYFLLSTTGPLLQASYARARGGAVPYRLFALSNFASLLALVSYPVAVEPFLATRRQTQWWSTGYAVFVLLCGAAAALSFARRVAPAPGPPAAESPGASPPWSLQLLWVALAACASTLLLAVTNHITKNVAPMPFLWVLPLGLYLLSFILCFEGRGWYRREWYWRLLLAAFAGMSYGLSRYGETASLPVVISIFSAGLFICCMVCHGELAALKPHPGYLTSFYLMCALGGALGGTFVGLVAPYLFQSSIELPIGLAGCVLLPALALYRRASGGLNRTPQRQARWAVAGLGAVLLFYTAMQIRYSIGDARLSVRNFYGVLRVIDSGGSAEDAVCSLTHGVVNHGEQFLHASRRQWPTAYYGPESGAGLALLRAGRGAPQRVGVVGLGAGVLATYGRRGDTYRFYEINPLVLRLAKTEFTFFSDSPAKVEVVLADGRLALEREASQQFDVLAVDAFSGDAVPVHLLTREAFAVYFRHLKPGGVLALHVSTTYLDLGPVVELAARAMGKEARRVDSVGDGARHLYPAAWVLVPDRREFFEDPAIQKAGRPIRPPRGLRLWTDDYSNLIQILR